MNRTAIFCAFASAALFGISTPVAKTLLGQVHPIILAGLLYCGAGIGAALLRRLVLPMFSAHGGGERSLASGEYGWLAGAIAAGGVIGPVLLMVGLARTAASTASLLLTLEGAVTALLAWFVFRENVNRRVAFGMACLIVGASVLAWSHVPTIDNMAGPLAIVGACVAWALDNNLTRKVSLSNPLQIVQYKGLIAGPFNVLLGLWVGGAWPETSVILVAGVVGFLSYGVSLVLFIIALRHLGTARTAAYFSTAPFVGAVVAVIGFKEPLTLQLIAAGALMALGVWLHLTERHEHPHAHSRSFHAHPHSHDAHHQHPHGPDDPSGEPHTHAHEHDGLRHSHTHMPDMHHVHGH